MRHLAVNSAILVALLLAASPAWSSPPRAGYRKITVRYLFRQPDASAPAPIAVDFAEELEDYGTFRLFYVPIPRLNDFYDQLQSAFVSLSEHDEYDLLQTSTRTIDTRLEPNPSDPPLDPPILNLEPRLYLVQFHGPIRLEWLDSLREIGAELDRPLVVNGYFVIATRATATIIRSLRFVEWVRPLTPELKAAPGVSGRSTVNAIVEFARSAFATTAIQRVRNLVLPASESTSYKTSAPSVVAALYSVRK